MNTVHPSSAELRRRAAVVEHYERGGKVQHRRHGGNVWFLSQTPIWNWSDYDYGPYVEPPKPKEGWSYVSPIGRPANLLFASKAECESWYEGMRDGGRAVLMREVVE